MRHPLDDARLKLERADLHLAELQPLVDGYRRARDAPFRLVGKKHPDGWTVTRFNVTTAPDRRWGLVAGDAIHNMRAALDYTVCELVKANNGKITKATAFPIFPDEPPEKDKRLENKIKGMDPDHAEAIRKMQPFADKDSERSQALLWASANDVGDKHHQLPAVLASFDHEARATGRTKDRDVEIHVTVGPVGHGDVIWRVRAPDEAVIKLESWVSPDVAFGNPPLVTADLRKIGRVIAGIVESFAPAFD